MIAYFKTYLQQAHFLLLPLSIFLITACPEPPDKPKPDRADCQKGFLPCEEDTTICCEVECPPGFLLGGADSTECIAVECPEYYYLCGDDSMECCLETTSHDFIWEVDTLGHGTYSVLFDVDIINENDIWVVGNIEIEDSSGEETDYNVAHWDGNDWELIQARDNIFNIYSLISSIKYFSPINIWIGINNPLHWNGVEWENMGYEAPPVGWINSIWGDSPDNIYFAGSHGKVSYYNGSTFEVYDSGLGIPFTDISGNGDHVFVLGLNSQAQSVVFEKKNDEWSELFYLDHYEIDIENEQFGLLESLEVLEDTVYIACSPGLIKYNYNTEEYNFDTSINYTYRWVDVTGNHPNDILYVNNGRITAHYNGEDTFYDFLLKYQIDDMGILGAKMNGNTAVIVGYNSIGPGALIARGQRINEQHK